MEFISQPYQPGETITAIATPPGEGGVAIVRISGNDAFAVGEKIFSRSLKKVSSHHALYGFIQNMQKERVDDVLLLPMRGPRSYTGEDTVEIFCHGGSLVTRRVLEVVLAAGARAALPGEFTFKAFINGKIDLVQAESIQTMIGAKNERALDAAEKQRDGSLSRTVAQLQERLTLAAAILEAWVDFPDEGLEFASFDEIIEMLEAVKREIAKLMATFHDGKILHEGLSLCLIGAPNVGKSSLMNALLNKERAIVSPIPGTTRDVLEDQMLLNGLHFRILDTAGMRETEEFIEQEGIRRSHLAMEQADLVLIVLEAHQPDDAHRFLQNIPSEKAILVWNKCDLEYVPNENTQFQHAVYVSALKKSGLDLLKAEIEKVIWKRGPPSKEEIVVTNVRHKEALVEAADAIDALIEGLKNKISPEFLTLETRTALKALGKIIGTNVSEDILSAIFSTFCIGK